MRLAKENKEPSKGSHFPQTNTTPSGHVLNKKGSKAVVLNPPNAVTLHTVPHVVVTPTGHYFFYYFVTVALLS